MTRHAGVETRYEEFWSRSAQVVAAASAVSHSPPLHDKHRCRVVSQACSVVFAGHRGRAQSVPLCEGSSTRREPGMSLTTPAAHCFTQNAKHAPPFDKKNLTTITVQHQREVAISFHNESCDRPALTMPCACCGDFLIKGWRAFYQLFQPFDRCFPLFIFF
jgi:hypothetical protein